MFTIDPYHRPTVEELLKEDFFTLAHLKKDGIKNTAYAKKCLLEMMTHHSDIFFNPTIGDN